MSVNSLLKYGLNEEIKFLKLLTTKINNDSIIIKKTEGQFCCVDYIITNLMSSHSIMIELKSRRVNLSKYNDFLIGYSKLNNISTEYNNKMVLLVWSDIYENVYFCEYKNNLLLSKTTTINGGKCFLINKSDTENGISKLINKILDI
tara:strand:- start:868 stop:1308 length:441 start_codon:yes stop_codon:yes gene_type:complete